jgi:hypothetical protein
MTPTEELLRSAVREAAGEIRPDSIGPLDLTAIRRPGSRRMARLLPAGPLGRPLAAAVAVAAVVGLSVAVPRVLTGNGTPTSGTGPTGVPTGAVDGIPPYYVALTGTAAPYQDHPLALTVRDTVTGQILATAAPPAGYGTFSLLAPGSDNTTFLVGAEPWHPKLVAAPPVGLFLARYDPAGRALTLTRLPVPLVPVNEVEGMAVSPDGRELALAVNAVPSTGPGDRASELDLRVYPLPGGTVRTWSLRGPAAAVSTFTNDPVIDTLSWRPDGHTVAFNWTSTAPAASAPAGGLRLLDTAGPGGDLITASRPLITMPEIQGGQTGIACFGSLMLAADGHSASCAGTATEESSLGGETAAPTPSADGTGRPSGQSATPAGTTPSLQQALDTYYGFYDVSPPDGAKLSGIRFRASGGLGFLGILWYSGTLGTFIGISDGRVFVMRDDAPTVSLPWDSRITPPPGGVTDVAW